MAVTKIRKISSWVLVACTIVALAVMGAFLFGGDDQPLNGKMWFPKNTEIVLYWMYAILAITVVALAIFAILQFITNLRTDAKKALLGLSTIIAFAALFFLTYTIGDGTAMARLSTSAATVSYNIPAWLKVADMMLFSIYIMFALAVAAIIFGSVRKIFIK